MVEQREWEGEGETVDSESEKRVFVCVFVCHCVSVCVGVEEKRPIYVLVSLHNSTSGSVCAHLHGMI